MLNLQMPEHNRPRFQDYGDVVILDTAAGEWIVLNRTAGDLWRSWESGVAFHEGVDVVARRYPDVPREAIEADARELLTQLIDRKIVGAAMPAADSHAPQRGASAAMAGMIGSGQRQRRARILTAMMALVCADILLRCSFRASLALVRLTRRGWCRGVPSADSAARTVAAVNAAARWYPGRAACLEQSLATVLLTAAVRHRLDWCLGSVPDPFSFHSWVAVAGQRIPVPGEDSVRTEYQPVLVA